MNDEGKEVGTEEKAYSAVSVINKKHIKKTQKVDIFSMGCVFYYLLTKGKHPFGERF